MREEYDFSKSEQNPYTKHLREEITIQVETSTIEYFKELSEETGIPYQNLMNLFLQDCAKQHRKPVVNWTD